ncbi:ABC transporter six-transmembrane domain-containing protein [Bacterioplanoides sp.]|uniref:ABC transporter six-transmembrane domain-containing protein n=1 Tax=Bacterioplanoides sp. TaxID=2066072 RepID=UPI003B5CA41A
MSSRVLSGPIGLLLLLRHFPRQIGITWLLVVIENALLALIPLLIGFAIDGLLQQKYDELLNLAVVFFALILISVGRRVYDTRAYGSIRVRLGAEVDKRHHNEEVSVRSARLDMARELVDFLENDVPELFTAVIQLVVSLIILAFFDARLAMSAGILLVSMIALYACFHSRFFRLNSALNSQVERQVNILNGKSPGGLVSHLRALRQHEIRLSDSDAILYGLIFTMIGGFIIFNLWLCASMEDTTPGKLFSIISYSWEYAEAAIALPMALQTLSRLKEISQRLNGFS